jgi:hypothetical protein
MGRFFYAEQEGYTREKIKKENAAYKIVKVDGGWVAFDSAEDYRLWVNQK